MNKFNFSTLSFKTQDKLLNVSIYLQSEVEYNSDDKQQYYRGKCDNLFKSLTVSRYRLLNRGSIK